MVNNTFDLDTPVLKIPDGDQAFDWTLRHAIQGCHIWGSSGSGKSSSSARLILMKYLSMGMGGLILTVKVQEKETIEEYCRLTGRTNDLIIIEPGRANYFNLLEHISSVDKDESFAANVVEALKTVLQSDEEKGGGNSDPFWESALHTTLISLVNLCQLAYGKVTAKMLYGIARTMPKKTEQGQAAPDSTKPLTAYAHAFIAAQQNVDQQKKDFKEKTDREQLQQLSPEALDQLLEDHVPDFRTMKQVDFFFFETLHDLNSRTRSIIDFKLNGFLFDLLQDPVYTLFCRHSSTFSPSDSYKQGKIILVNLPVKKYHGAGRSCQILMKYIYQRDMEKRNPELEQRPCFIYADESQHFIHRHDTEFQATARGSLVATLYISQNLPNYYVNMGGTNSEHKVRAFTATLGTQIFHANTDTESNKFAETLCGQAWQKDESEAHSATDGKVTVTRTISASLKPTVRAEELGLLATGGPKYNFSVTAYMHVMGARFSNGFNHRKTRFNQKNQTA